jgi:hypothetical protein
MWFAARDIAFENPATEDQTAQMLARMGISNPSGPPPDFAKLYAEALANRVLPGDIDFTFESMLNRMIGLLFIEITAFHSFAWAEGVLEDRDLCAGDGEAARIISYVRQDESPHVAYLKVALSEMRDRTWVGENGERHDGAEMIQLLWDKGLTESRFGRRSDFLKMTVREIEHSLEGRTDRDDVIDEFFALGTVQLLDDGSFVETLRSGEQIEVPA